MTVIGTRLHAIDYELKIASAQIKSAIILAALSAEGETTISGEIHSRDHTERFLPHFGASVSLSPEFVRVKGGQRLVANAVHVPGDPSTAAFWMAAACLVPQSRVEMHNIALNPTRIGFVRALQRMGARVKIEITSESPEPVGSILVTSSELKGIRVSKDEVPTFIDELPLLAVLATQATGVTEVEGAEELRVKESDRIEAVATNLRAMGAEIEVRKDGYRIEGPQKLKGASIESFHDHRIAMAFSIGGLVAQGQTTIQGADCVGISYPEFFSTLEELTR
jgi:3-phosphoshikimate 1-carboxyvinyltransferase